MKRLATTVAMSLVLLSSSPATYTPVVTAEPVTIRAIPPTFITLDPIAECIPSAPFPQINPLPYFDNGQHVQFSCSVYDKDHVAWSMLIFYELWERKFGDPDGQLMNALNKVTIVWGKDVKTVNNVYDMDGNFLEKATVSGLMKNDTTIWVWAESENISDTSLVHELVHIELHHICGDADADHEGELFPCWKAEHSSFIDMVNEVLSYNYGL